MNAANRSTGQNVIVVVSDTLRTAFLGCYGNDEIDTRNIDKFAGDGALFAKAYPESLPTIPMRRAVHTGRRAFPFADYRPVPWDNVYIPGWQPMSRNETTIAETLVQAGYHTGFYADVPHYFVPGMNFIRGFRQWEYIRGQAEDRYNAAHRADEKLLLKYVGGSDRNRHHIVNVRPEMAEEEWPTARTFRKAIQFVQENRSNTPFYLYVDTFSPHETWESPIHYYELYGKLEDRIPLPLNTHYGPISQNPEFEPYIPTLRANYSGLVTMVDRWFGKLLDTIDGLGLRDNTTVIFTSDHGTNFADNCEGVVGKPAPYLYPGTMHVPLIIRYPDGAGAGSRIEDLVYTLDIPATILDICKCGGSIDGQSLDPLMRGDSSWTDRGYLTCRYGNTVWYFDNEIWFFSSTEFEEMRLFDIRSDPGCTVNIAEKAPDLIQRAKAKILDDAGGALVTYERKGLTDALGRPVFETK